MQYRITSPNTLRGQIQLPASKSISNRTLLINALSGNTELPQNVSDCDDTRVMLAALQNHGFHNNLPINIGAAGTAMRFLTAYFSVTNGIHLLTGSERMKQRPIRVLVEALRSLGAHIKYTGEEGFPPLHIEGQNLHGGDVELAGNVSSQYISALLMIGTVLEQGLTLTLTGGIVSRPYIDLTLQIMRSFNANAAWTHSNVIRVEPQPYTARPYFIENDWSGASYWYEMMALTPDPKAHLTLAGLFRHSDQGDARVQEFFEALGVTTEPHTNGVTLRKIPPTQGTLQLNLTHQPDLAQTLVVTCVMQKRAFHFTGLQSLKIKETDRIKALCCELAKLGYDLKEANDAELFWNGEYSAPQQHAVIETYDDHRMALAFAPCALVLPVLRINHPEVVSKSYPQYWENLEQVGFKIEKQL
ncbi:MAG: 3-phosphoshikimate 1-carboxyvinyltransferase [Bacteroidaceae bacterium]